MAEQRLGQGERLSLLWTPRQADFDMFAEISGDSNPIHVDAAFSAGTRFGRTVSHGMLLYTRLWGLLQCRFPGMMQLEQALMFPNPAFAGEELQFEATIEGVGSDGSVQLAVSARRVADGETVLSGRASLRDQAD